MLSKFVTATVSAALCVMSVAPAMAQEYRFTGFDAPQGVSRSVNLRVPVTRESRQRQRPSYGVSVGYGQRMPLATMDGRTATRSVGLADIRFTDRGNLNRAQVLSFDLRNLDQDRRLNLSGDNGGTLWVVVGLVAAGVAICLLADCFEGDDDSSSSN